MARVISEASVRIDASVREGERDAERAGERFGRAFAEGADREAGRSDLAAVLAEQVEQASQRVARARDAEAAAADRVIDADRRLSVERAKGAGRTDDLIDAEQRLDVALRRFATTQDESRDASVRLGQAQSALQGEMARSESSSGRLSGAFGRLRKDADFDFSRLTRGATESGGAFNGAAVKLAILAGAAKGLSLILKPNIFAELIPVALGAAAAVVELSGALLILPGVITTAGLALGAIKIATSGFGDALKAMGDPEKFAEAIAKLTPSAREAAVAVQGLKGRFDELKKSLQEKLFSGLAKEITATGRTMMDVLQPAMESIVTSSNAMVKGLLQDFRSLRGQKVFTEIGTEGARAFDNIIKAVRPLVQAFLDVASVGAKVFADITGGVGAATQRFSEWIRQLKESGKLEEIMRRGVEAVKQLGTVVKNVFSIIGSVMKAGEVSGAGFLQSLVKITTAIANFAKSVQGQFVLTSFFELLKAVQVIVAELKPLGPAILATMLSVTKALQTVAPLVTPLAASFADLVLAIQPLIPVAGQVAATVISGITTVFRELRPVVETLVAAITGFVTNALPGLGTGFAVAVAATLPFLKVLAELALVILPPLGTALGAIAPILAPLTPLILGVYAATKLWSAGLTVVKAALGAWETAMSVLGVVKWAATHTLHFLAVAASATASAAKTAGAWIASTVAMVANAVTQGAVWLATMLANFVKAAASAVAQAAITSGAWIAAGVAMVASQLAQGAIWLASWIATGVAAAASSVTSAAVAAGAWIAANIAMIAATGGIVLAIAAVIAIGYLIIKNWDTIKATAAAVWNAIRSTVTTALSAVGNVISSFVSSAINFFGNLASNVGNIVSSLVNRVISFFANLRNNTSSTISSLVADTVRFFFGLPGQILSALGNLGSMMFNIGMDLVNGIGRGLLAGWNYLLSLVRNLATSMFNTAKAALGIGSPSKLFRDEIGKQLAQGAAIGVRARTSEVVDAVREMADAATAAGRIDLKTVISQVQAPLATQIRSAAADRDFTTSADRGNLADTAREAVSIVQNIYNPSITDATDSSNRELRRFAAMGGFSR